VRVEAPLLQVVMNRLWEEELRAGSTVLRAETLAALGGAEHVFRFLVDDALGGFSTGEQQLAAEVFQFLVTPTGTKVALAAADLAAYCGVPLEEMGSVLGKLSSAVRILRPVQSAGPGDPMRFEIFHDVLAQPVLDWSRRHASESRVAVLERAVRGAERRFRLALAGCAALLAALLVVILF
jgi:hypothetical protein